MQWCMSMSTEDINFLRDIHETKVLEVIDFLFYRSVPLQSS